jgi:hypothetical protein
MPKLSYLKSHNMETSIFSPMVLKLWFRGHINIIEILTLLSALLEVVIVQPEPPTAQLIIFVNLY